MKPIPGVNLQELIGEADAEFWKEQHEQARKVIRGIHNNLRSWESEINNKTREVVKLNENIVKAKAKLEQISKGDWSLIEESKQQEKSAT